MCSSPKLNALKIYLTLSKLNLFPILPVQGVSNLNSISYLPTQINSISLSLSLYIYIYIYIVCILATSVFAKGLGDLDSIPGRVIPKTLKMVFHTSLFNTQQYKVLFTNPSTRAGYDTRSIFKRSLTGFEFRVFLLLD